MLGKGFLHGDNSINEVLISDFPVMTKPLKGQTVEELVIQLSLKYGGELIRHANILGNVIEKVGTSDKCRDVIIGGNVVVSLEDHFMANTIQERDL